LSSLELWKDSNIFPVFRGAKIGTPGDATCLRGEMRCILALHGIAGGGEIPFLVETRLIGICEDLCLGVVYWAILVNPGEPPDAVSWRIGVVFSYARSLIDIFEEATVLYSMH